MTKNYIEYHVEKDISLQNLYIDESGSPPRDKHFVIIVLLVKEIHSLKTIKSAIEDLQHDTGIQDIKGSQLNIEHKKHFMNKIYEANFEIWVPFNERIKMNVANIDKDSLVRLSLHYVRTFLKEAIVSYDGLTNVIFDEHTLFYKSETQPSDKNLVNMSDKKKDRYGYFKTWKWDSLKKCLPQDVPVPRIVEGKSQYVKGIMAADIFANGIYQSREKGQTEFFSLFKDKIKVITEHYRF